MAFSSNNKGKLFTEINITPLTDIFLVLLIIMMVVAPTFQSMDNAITIPEINSGVAIEHCCKGRRKRKKCRDYENNECGTGCRI